ncbi:parathyroid hormone 1a [Cheilinus undulatus]|uniref:parathyroid hormone 1a n=1 Tax=Cheilinus undulatus TaxID=241271 RepID=UPI001BD2B8B4|nr:parathyroid hormone 1a [Cheilinus undulatus]
MDSNIPFRIIMVNMQNLGSKIMIMSLCILHVLTLCEGGPMRKRTVSEVQFMHNLGEHRQLQERRDWLQMRLRGIHSAPSRSSSGEAGRLRRRPRPEELADLSDLTPEEFQYAIKILEKLLKSKHP